MKKQILTGLATVALTASMVSANVNAYGGDVIDELPSELYTIVGPNYFTLSNLDMSEIYNYDDYMNVYIEDTDVADFLTSPFGDMGMVQNEDEPPMIMVCSEQYPCLQGKEKGTTNLVIEDDGRVLKRIRITSAELSPTYANHVPAGIEYEETGHLDGADESLLTLDHVYTPSSKVQIEKTGERSFKINSVDQIDQGKVAYAVWKIGDQFIGGGSTYNVIMIETNELASADEGNKRLLSITTAKLFETIANDPWNYGNKLMNGIDLPHIKVANGAVLDVFHPGSNERWVAYMPGFAGSKYVTSLYIDDADEDMPEDDKEALNDNLPEKAEAVGIGNVHADIYSVAPNMFNPDEIFTTFVGDILEFGGELKVTVKVPEVEAAKANYQRTWTIAFTDYNGKTENIEAEFDEETSTLSFMVKKAGKFSYGFVDEYVEPVPLVPDTGAAPVKVAMTAAATFIPLLTVAFVTTSVRAKKRANNKLAKKHNQF